MSEYIKKLLVLQIKDMKIALKVDARVLVWSVGVEGVSTCLLRVLSPLQTVQCTLLLSWFCVFHIAPTGRMQSAWQAGVSILIHWTESCSQYIEKLGFIV